MKVWVLQVNEGVDRWDQRDHTLVFSSKAKAHQFVAETQGAALQESADWLTQEDGAQWASADGYYWELREQTVDSGDTDEAVA